jgi:hypothetical protein
MPNKRKAKRRNRNGQGNGQSLTVRTPSQAFERTVASRSDRTRLMGKVYFGFTSTSTGYAGVNITPSLLGVRPGSYATLYTKWRIARLILKPLQFSTAATSNQPIFAGFLDDSVTSGDIPISGVAILDLRCSVSSVATSNSATVAGATQTTFNEFEWKPLRGPPQWYYATVEGSSSDPRLEVPCSLWIGSPTASALSANFEIDYDIYFEGACDVLSAQ